MCRDPLSAERIGGFDDIIDLIEANEWHVEPEEGAK